MARFLRVLLALGLLSLATLACQESREIAEQEFIPTTPEFFVAKGQRILELDANGPENGNYDQVMALARELGAESIRLSVFWDDIEIEPGVYQPDPNWLAIANQYYSAQGFSISLVISVLDTTEIRLPADLEGRSFDDPEVIARFQGLLEYVKTQVTDVELVSLAIGNEIDGVLGNKQSDWQEFKTFYELSAANARGLWPDLPVSTKVTFEGLIGPTGETARALYDNSDVVMTTYYPLEGDFTVRDPEVIKEDFQILADLFPDKKIHITEIGYPSSEVNGSSQAKQARFIQAMFQAWDENADQIPVLSYSWLSDLPEESVQELQSYYGFRDNRFGEFLRTLGLRTYTGSGENKEGFLVFSAEAKARGW